MLQHIYDLLHGSFLDVDVHCVTTSLMNRNLLIICLWFLSFIVTSDDIAAIEESIVCKFGEILTACVVYCMVKTRMEILILLFVEIHSVKFT